MFAALAATTALVLMPLTPANARMQDETPAADAQTGPNTEIVISSLEPGLSATAFYQPPTPIVPDPEALYPVAPPADYVAQSGYLGIINTVAVGDATLTGQMYCINVRVSTQVGIGYESGTWEESTVPNIPYVTYILTNYFPTVTDAPDLPTPDEQAAAVQAAIWYFTDGVVLGDESAELRAATAAIIAAAQGAIPPLPTEPAPPDVAITPSSAAAPAGTAAGPFVVTAESDAEPPPEITVSVPIATPPDPPDPPPYTMYTDAAATMPLANPSNVTSGTSIWVTGPGVTEAETVLTARAAVTVQRGNVYLYDGNTPGLEDAQRLILAVNTELSAVAQATTEFFTPGDLTVNKAFTGGAVGEQGASQLVIDCEDGFTFTEDIPAGADTTQTFTFTGIPVGNTCTVTEPTTGTTNEVIVTSDAPQEDVITSEGAAVTVTNTVEFAPGTLNLVKVIAGGGAGFQDEISVSITCVSGLEETFTIPAGSAAGEYSPVSPPPLLPAGDVCTVAELESGANTVVDVTTDGPVTVTISPGAAVEARVTNAVEFLPGSLNVTKVISGAGSGSQDAISVSIVCDTGVEATLTIPAGSPAGEYTQSVDEIPAGDECTVTELQSGANAVVEVAAGDPVTVTIEPGAAVAVDLANTVTFRPGSLSVVKVIIGPGAGLQSAISIGVVCENGLVETFDIPARSAAGQYVQTFSDLPAGTECTVTELSSGANSAASVVADTSVTVTIEPGAEVAALLTNSVQGLAGETTVQLASAGAEPMPALGAGAGLLGIGLLVLAAVRGARRKAASTK